MYPAVLPAAVAGVGMHVDTTACFVVVVFFRLSLYILILHAVSYFMLTFTLLFIGSTCILCSL